jgi:predicted HicB family RNase H-like nuclease
MTEASDQRELDRSEQVYQEAFDLFSRAPDWETFFRTILGVHGVVRRHFSTREDLAEFEQTEAYGAIQEMLAKLREREGDQPGPREPTRVITVRLPKSLHEALREEAYEHRTSMNKLCISKLVRLIDNELIPENP